VGAAAGEGDLGMNNTMEMIMIDDSPPRNTPSQATADGAGPRVCPSCTYADANAGRGQQRCDMCEGLLSGEGKAEALGRQQAQQQHPRLAGEQDGAAASEASAMMLENVPCPACTFEGGALDAVECDVCATSFFGSGGEGGEGGVGSGTGSHRHNHEHMSLAALRAMAAAADGASSRTSCSCSRSGGVGREGGQWGGEGASALPEMWRERLMRGQQEERRDCTWGIIENLMVIASEAPLVPLGRVREVSTIRLCSPLAHYCQVFGGLWLKERGL